MKENKDAKLEIRVTKEEKQKIKALAAERGITVSELIRIALERMLY